MEGGDIDLTSPMGMSSLPVKNEVNVIGLQKLTSELTGKRAEIPMINVSVLSSSFRCWRIHVIVLMNLCSSLSLPFFCRYQKSSFNTYQPSLAPYVSIVPTSSSALLIRPPSAIQQQQASSILIGSGGLNNNPSILAQSPSNLGKKQRGCACAFERWPERNSLQASFHFLLFIIKLIFIRASRHSASFPSVPTAPSKRNALHSWTLWEGPQCP